MGSCHLCRIPYLHTLYASHVDALVDVPFVRRVAHTRVVVVTVPQVVVIPERGRRPVAMLGGDERWGWTVATVVFFGTKLPT
jgi:hypothetical protein